LKQTVARRQALKRTGSSVRTGGVPARCSATAAGLAMHATDSGNSAS
jgi:hypothetical protein